MNVGRRVWPPFLLYHRGIMSDVMGVKIVPTINNGAVLEVATLGKFDTTHDIANVYQLQLSSGGPVEFANLVDDIDGWVDAILGIIKAANTILMLWTSFRVQTLDNNITSGIVALDANIAGTMAGDANAVGVAGLICMNTGFSRRQLRKYIGPLGEGAIGTAGTLNSNFTTPAGSLITYLSGTQTFNGRSYKFGHANAGQANFVQPISYFIPSEPAYQRRRRRGSGS